LHIFYLELLTYGEACAQFYMNIITRSKFKRFRK